MYWPSGADTYSPVAALYTLPSQSQLSTLENVRVPYDLFKFSEVAIVLIILPLSFSISTVTVLAFLTKLKRGTALFWYPSSGLKAILSWLNIKLPFASFPSAANGYIFPSIIVATIVFPQILSPFTQFGCSIIFGSLQSPLNARYGIPKEGVFSFSDSNFIKPSKNPFLGVSSVTLNENETIFSPLAGTVTFGSFIFKLAPFANTSKDIVPIDLGCSVITPDISLTLYTTGVFP